MASCSSLDFAVAEQVVPSTTILVVEDEPLVRLMTADNLRDFGYQVLEASSGDEAIRLLTAAESRVDIVFSDIQMPGAHDGLAVSRWVRANRPGMQVLLTSGNIHAAAWACPSCHDGAVVAKPYGYPALLRRIRSMHELQSRD